MISENLQHGRTGLGVSSLTLPLLQPPEHRRVFQAQLNVECYPDQDDAQQERYAPGPGRECLLSEDLGDQEEDGVTEHEPDRDPHLGEAAVVTPLALGGVLRRQEHRSAPLAADGEALQEAQHEEGYRGSDPDGLVGRQEADERRRRAHGQQRDYQGRFAAEPVPEVAEEYPAYRTRHEADRRRAERGQHPGDLAAAREEQRTEDQGRRRQVDKEVVPLDRRPRHRRQGYLPHRGRARCRSLRARFSHDYPPITPFLPQKDHDVRVAPPPPLGT